MQCAVIASAFLFVKRGRAVALASMLAIASAAAANAQPHAAAGIALVEARPGEEKTAERPAVRRLKPKFYPRAVRAVLDAASRECRAAGGMRLDMAPQMVRRIDLTGDGHDDYIIDFAYAECAERPAMFNGTGGSDFAILVARPEGGFVRVFDGRIHGYELSGGPGRRTMTFSLHGAYCGQVGSSECIKRRRIGSRPFAFRDR